eukprot:gene8579-34727_t
MNFYMNAGLLFTISVLFGDAAGLTWEPCRDVPNTDCKVLDVVMNPSPAQAEGAYKIEVDLGECKSNIDNGTVDTQLFLPANSTKAVNERKIDYCS